MLLSITELCWKDTHNKCCLSVSTLLYEEFICFTSDSSSYNLFSVNQRWIPHFTIPLRGINKKRRWDDIKVSVSPFLTIPCNFNHLKIQVMEKGRGWCLLYIQRALHDDFYPRLKYIAPHRERTVAEHPANLNLQGLVQILVGKVYVQIKVM